MMLKTKNDLLKFMRMFYACAAATQWVKECKLKTAKAIYENCEDPNWIQWLIYRAGPRLTAAENSKVTELRERQASRFQKLWNDYFLKKITVPKYNQLYAKLRRGEAIQTCKLLRKLRPWSMMKEPELYPSELDIRI